MVATISIMPSRRLSQKSFLILKTLSRTEITTDADDKLLGYREKDGTKYEHKQKVENMSVNHFSNLSQTACQDIVNSLSAYGLTLENKLDFSDNTDIFIPIPRGVAVVNIIADSLATSKTQNKDAILEFWGSGIYFRKNIILNAQGQTSMNLLRKASLLTLRMELPLNLVTGFRKIVSI